MIKERKSALVRFLCGAIFSGLFLVVESAPVMATLEYGSGSSAVNTDDCGDSPNCYSGRVFVHYSYKSSFKSGTTRVGDIAIYDSDIGGYAYSFDIGSRSGFFRLNDGTPRYSEISNKCHSRGNGFWHLEYRTSKVGGVEMAYAFGSSPMNDLTDDEIMLHSGASGVVNGNYNSAQVTPDGWASSMSDIEKIYNKWRESSDPTWDAFLSSTNTWFCGDASTVVAPTVYEVNASAAAGVEIVNIGDFSGKGTSSNPYVAKDAGTKTATLKFSHTITRTDSTVTDADEKNGGMAFVWRAYNSIEGWRKGSYDNVKTGDYTYRWSEKLGHGSGVAESARAWTQSFTKKYSDKSLLSLTLNSNKQKVCARTTVWGRKKEGDGAWYNWNNKNSNFKCIYIKGKVEETVTFSNALDITKDSKLSCNAAGYCKGDGYTTKYTLKGEYTVTRDDSTSIVNANLACKTGLYVSNDASRQTTGATTNCKEDLAGNYTTTGAGKTRTVPGGEKTITVPVGTTSSSPVTVCFYLNSYSSVVYTDGVAGTPKWYKNDKEKCVYLYNPPVTATVTFSGTTAGAIDIEENHDLKFTTNYTEAKLIHGGAMGTYTGKFTHRLSWSNYASAPSWLTSAATGWTIQYSHDGTTYNNLAGATGTQTFTNGTAKTVQLYTHTFTLNSGNVGKYSKYCQRMLYNPSATYKKSGAASATRESLGGAITTPGVCLVIRNPRWGNSTADLKGVIRMDGETTGDAIEDGTVLWTGEYYNLRTITAKLTFNHKITRTDNEGDDGGATDTETDRFYEGTKDSEIVPRSVTDSSGPENRTMASRLGDKLKTTTTYKGIGTFGESTLNLTPQGGTGGGLAVTLGRGEAAFSSDTTKGQTSLTVGAKKNESEGVLEVLAGQTGNVCVKTENAPSDWEVKYQDKFDIEEYDSGYAPSGFTAEKYYINTSPVSAAPVAVSGSKATSGCRNVKVHRDYNYNIESIDPTEWSEESVRILTAGKTVSASFKTNVKRDGEWGGIEREYITGLDNSEYSVITFVIKEDNSEIASLATMSGKTEWQVRQELASPFIEGTTSYSGDFADFYNKGENAELAGIDRVNVKSVEPLTETTVDSETGKYASGNWVSTMESYSFTINVNDLTVPDNLAVGDKFCVAVGITHKRSSDTSRTEKIISPANCGNIGKYPSVHVWGGSVQSNGGISTSYSAVAGTGSTTSFYGSWGDFGAIANGAIRNFSSGRGIVKDGLNQSESFNGLFCDQGAFSPLTIANSDCGDNSTLGNSGFQYDRDVFSYMKNKYAGFALGTNVINEDNVGSLTSGGGAHVVYNSTSNPLVIKTDIGIDSNEYSVPNDIPQVLILSEGPVYITENVMTRVDAWIISKGQVDTCVKDNGTPYGASELNAGVCKDMIEINGPIMGSSIRFTRTANADKSTIAKEAETVNFTAATVLFSAAQAGSGEPTITYLKKMPARY